MGEDPGTGGPAVTGSEENDQIRREIDETRQELGDTVEALAAKTDVKAQAKRKAAETKESVMERKDELLGKAKQASPDQVTSAASQMPQKARENPVPVAAVAAFGAGFLAGRLTKR